MENWKESGINIESLWLFASRDNSGKALQRLSWEFYTAAEAVRRCLNVKS
jgi:hypothetical protein